MLQLDIARLKDIFRDICQLDNDQDNDLDIYQGNGLDICQDISRGIDLDICLGNDPGNDRDNDLGNDLDSDPGDDPGDDPGIDLDIDLASRCYWTPCRNPLDNLRGNLKFVWVKQMYTHVGNNFSLFELLYRLLNVVELISDFEIYKNTKNWSIVYRLLRLLLVFTRSS